MIDSIFSAAKGELMQQLGSKFQIDPSKTGQVVDLAKDNISSGLLKEVTGGNVSGLMDLFNGNGNVAGSPIVTKIVNQLVGSLTAKAGLNSQVATAASSFIVPFIIGKISGKKPAGGFDVASLSSAFTAGGGGLGGAIKSGLGKKLGDTLGKFFK